MQNKQNNLKNLEYVVLVDENDQEIGVSEKLTAHQLGLLHRAFSVLIIRNIENNKNNIEILLQQRALGKYHCGGLWTNTCCSHPRINENIIQAGIRRLQEEMYIKTDLHQIGSFIYKAVLTNGLIEHEFDHVLIGKYNSDIININPNEVEDYRWVKLKTLEQELIMNFANFTPWFKQVIEIAKQEIASL